MLKHTLQKLHQGFTVIETMIVIAIVGIVTAVAFSAYQSRPLDDATLDRLKNDIVNDDVGSGELAKKGFYGRMSGGQYLDACRRETREQFQDASTKRHAEAIVDCILAKRSNEPKSDNIYIDNSNTYRRY